MKNQVNALTGNRNLGNIGIEYDRDYLPKDWDSIMHLLDESNPYKTLSLTAEEIRNTQFILKEEELKKLSPELSHLIREFRNKSAILQALGQEAYKKAVQRLSQLQELIDYVSKTQDAKAALDLQTRIQTEQAMLQNETIKLMNLHELVSLPRETVGLITERLCRIDTTDEIFKSQSATMYKAP